MKKKIFIILTPILLLLTSTIVFAAFLFIKEDNIEANTGKITINQDNTSLISYQDKNLKDYRTDMVYKFEDITFTTAIDYAVTSDVLFISGKTYYTKNDDEYSVYSGWSSGSPINYTETSDTTYSDTKTYYTRTILIDNTNTFTEVSKTEYNAGDSIPSGTILYEFNDLSLYEQIKTNIGVASIGSALYKNDSSVSEQKYSLSENNTNIKLTNTSYVLKLEFNTAGIKNVIVYDNNDELVNNLYARIDSDFKGFIILNSKLSTNYTPLDDNAASCSATKDKSNNNYMYLNQLGYKLDFTCELACFVRIHIRDAWIGTKVYATANKETYNLKGLAGNTSPFNNLSDEWYYDQSENTLYLKTMITPTKDENGDYSNHVFIFNVNEAYFYSLESVTTTYKEYIDVEVSFNVDIVQANRVYAVWGVDPTKLG